ncbi:hypothetical protein MES4922_40029 [Mesorhizobium ventifaucium]|uniref:Uncharacterized protein n=1 Tax=Mesorhizobium ventifaucium TaxID=666020 RepID=A0ABM9E7C6_9HYPH|nr:hypothetical protein MES4922_40029 [Mesorhizobium ventifaucium]
MAFGRIDGVTCRHFVFLSVLITGAGRQRAGAGGIYRDQLAELHDGTMQLWIGRTGWVTAAPTPRR